MRHAKCPSCGAAVEFKSAVSVLAVCDYCQSTLLRNDDAIENLGKMAALIADKSPLQRGAEGKVDGVHFAVIGRIQLRYSQGLWNEWHLLFDDGKSGWLSEAGGEYVFSRPLWVPDTLPAFADVQVGQQHLIDGKAYRVTNIENAECVAGEGELPFKVGAGYPAPVVDLRDEKGNFATLDYSDVCDQLDNRNAKPLLFIGKPMPFKSFAWANLRQDVPIPEINVKARAIKCPSCGAGLSVRSDAILTVGCTSCGTVLDPTHEVVESLGKGSFKQRVEPLIALGSKGTLRGEAVEAIGFMRRRMKADGIDYYWSEYVLLGPDGKLLWLTESDGHWNLARVLERSVAATPLGAKCDGKDYKHFAGYDAFVDYVLGEFPWRVEIEEKVRLEDYVAPPSMLSRERSPKEETWTLSEYVLADELETAFGLAKAGKTLPKPAGVYANQPNPAQERHQSVCRSFWRFALAALAIHFALLFVGPGGNVLREKVRFDNSQDEPRVSQEFKLPDGARRLEIAHDTDLNNNWVALNLTLVNKDNGTSWQVNRELSRYEGVDGGESWSEGSRDDEIVFTDLPPGTYVLAEEAELDAAGRPVSGELRVNRAGPRWSTLFVLLVGLMLFPIITRWRQYSFEVDRWAESDHPMVSASSDDDDDD
jgi:ribosomal protein S27E